MTATTTPKTMSVPEAGRVYFGIGRDSSYQAAKTGQIPVIRIGKLLRVPIVAMERMLDRASDDLLVAARDSEE